MKHTINPSNLLFYASRQEVRRSVNRCPLQANMDPLLHEVRHWYWLWLQIRVNPSRQIRGFNRSSKLMNGRSKKESLCFPSAYEFTK